jgi:hypothetical protein
VISEVYNLYAWTLRVVVEGVQEKEVIGIQ